MLSKRYELTEVARRTWLRVPSGTLWSTSSETHQLVEIKKRLLLRLLLLLLISYQFHKQLHFRTQRTRDFFARFDDKGDGTVPIADVFRGFETMGFDVDAGLKGRIQGMDQNSDGMISYCEFVRAQLIQRKVPRPSEIEGTHWTCQGPADTEEGPQTQRDRGNTLNIKLVCIFFDTSILNLY